MPEEKATITLATEYNPKTCEFPAGVSPKFDGIPVKITRCRNGNHAAVSRQGEPVKSIDHILEYMDANPELEIGEFVVGEAVVPADTDNLTEFLPFETGGGYVRRRERDSETDSIVVFMFDQGFEDNSFYEDPTYYTRRQRINFLARRYAQCGLYRAPEYNVGNHAEVAQRYTLLKEAYPGLEGVMIRPDVGVFEAGKRCKHMLRWKELDTHDLKIVGFEEAVEGKTKKPKGMVGRIIVEYNGTTSGVGPGNMKHDERITVWNNRDQYIGRIAEIASKPSTYKGLREGRFKRWRPDKDED